MSSKIKLTALASLFIAAPLTFALPPRALPPGTNPHPMPQLRGSGLRPKLQPKFWVVYWNSGQKKWVQYPGTGDFSNRKDAEKRMAELQKVYKDIKFDIWNVQ